MKRCNGIDRIDSSKGYTIDNCALCCRQCNYLKNNMSQDDFADWILSIHLWAIKHKEEEELLLS